MADLKTKIEESREDHGAARQKLIHAGKVLKDEQLISELGIAESDFIVCMITKEIAKVSVAIPSVASFSPNTDNYSILSETCRSSRSCARCCSCSGGCPCSCGGSPQHPSGIFGFSVRHC